MKHCNVCDTKKIVEEFYKSAGKTCKDCMKAYNRDWHAANPARAMLRSARRRALKYDIPFDIVVSDIKIPTYCPALGIPLVAAAENNAPTPNSPSLDRIKPELGYVKGNIIVVSLKANQIKSNATLEEILKVYEFYDWQINAGVAQR
jgi:hypothetical protein